MTTVLNPVEIFGIALAVCSLGGGSFWLLDDLITSHLPPRFRAPAGAAVGIAILALVVLLITIGIRP